MKRYIFLSIFLVASISCQKDESVESSGKSSQSDRPCGTYKSGQSLRQGPEGGCYYINPNGNKTYVEREACKC